MVRGVTLRRPNDVAGPRNLYLDNVVIQDVTEAGFAQRLNGSANEKYGLARSVSVAPGDVLRLEVYAKYVDASSGNWTAVLTSLMGQIAANTAGVVVDGAGYSTSTSTFGYGGLLAHGDDGTGPKAYLNWLIFDKNYTLIDGGFTRLSSAPREDGQKCTQSECIRPTLRSTSRATRISTLATRRRRRLMYISTILL